LEAGSDRLQIVLVAEEIEADARRLERVVRAEENLAPAFRVQQARPNPEPVVKGSAYAGEPDVGVGRRSTEHELDVGYLELGPRLDERMQPSWHHGAGPGSHQL